MSMLRNVKRLLNTGRVRCTYDGDGSAKPGISCQCPDTIAETHLNYDRTNSDHHGNVYEGVMRTAEVLDVAGCGNEPIIDI